MTNFAMVAERDIEGARRVLTGDAPIVSSVVLRRAINCLKSYELDTSEEVSHYPPIHDMT
jgi:hypothetical protein